MDGVCRLFLQRVFLGSALLLPPLGSAAAQDLPLADRAPRFLAISSAAAAPIEVDVSRVSTLTRRVSLALDEPTVGAVLEAISRQTGIRFAYSADVVQLDRPVTLRAENITVAAALLEVLMDVGVDVLLQADSRLALVKRPARQVALADGSVTGTVTDSATGSAVAGAEVFLEGTKWRAGTGENGHYRLTTVRPGSYTLTVRRIGYAKQSQAVTVAPDTAVTVDVVLRPAPTQLNELVSTATGDQRALELGHVVARINVDSLVKEAPISNLSELLQSRVPGLQVLTGSGGVAGGAVSLNLRGLTSLSLSSEPIVIVDGVRFKSTNQIIKQGAFTAEEDTRGQGELRSPLNDLNVNDIETVEVVKGPSASTLYGPDAANGVILISTKRGKSGTPQFRWYVRPVSNSVPTKDVAKAYRVWGHDPTTGETVDFNCSVVRQYSEKSCVQDSITVAATGFDTDAYSLVEKRRPTWQYGANVSGGTPAIRYFFSGNYESQVGSIQLPSAMEDYLKGQVGSAAVSEAIREPNALRTVGVHTSLAADVLRHGTVSLTASYSQSVQRRTDVASVFQRMLQVGALLPDTTDITQFINPRNFLNQTDDRSNRLTASLTGVLSPLPWLTLNASAGIDLDAAITHAGAASGLLTQDDPGHVEDDRRNSTGRTLSVGATAMARPGRWSFRTSTGVQYTYQRLDGLSAFGSNLAPGSTSIGTATTYSSTPVWSEIASLGTYGEELVGFNDRLFLTGSLRLDGSSSFGDAYHARPYPKLGISWLASEEPFLRNLPGVSELRFRAAYGAASRYPTSAMKLGVVSSASTLVDGSQVTIFTREALANPKIRPERSRETEAGADFTLLSRINVGLTLFERKTMDLLEAIQNPSGLKPQWGNVASIKAHGFEATAHATVLDRKAIRADLSFSYAFNTTRVLSLGDALDSRIGVGGYAVGYPLGAAFGQPIIGVADTVGGVADGIILPQEVIRSSTRDFLGVTIPPRTFTLVPSVALLNGHLRMSTLFDRQTGFVVYDFYRSACRDNATCLGPFLTSTPPLEQARYVGGSQEDFIQPGDFVRWREMTISADIPERWLRIVHMSHGSVSLQGRNLALWTTSSKSDPESRSGTGLLYPSWGTAPQAGGWSFRFDVTP